MMELVGMCSDPECRIYEKPYPGPGRYCEMEHESYMRGIFHPKLVKRRAWICYKCWEEPAFHSKKELLEHDAEDHEEFDDAD